MPLVVAERRQTAAWPANLAPQPWQMQLIQAPALAPSRPHTHTHTHTHTPTHTHTHTIVLVNPQRLDFQLLCLFLSHCSHMPAPSLLHSVTVVSFFSPSVASSLSLSCISCLPLYFSPHPPFKYIPPLPSWPPPSIFLWIFSSLFNCLSSSSPLGSQQGWPWCSAPYLGPWAHAQTNTHPHTQKCTCAWLLQKVIAEQRNCELLRALIEFEPCSESAGEMMLITASFNAN